MNMDDVLRRLRDDVHFYNRSGSLISDMRVNVSHDGHAWNLLVRSNFYLGNNHSCNDVTARFLILS